MYYSNAMRAKVKEENPDATFGDIAKIVASKYKSLTPEERAEYEAQATKDKKRYQEESKLWPIRGYKPPLSLVTNSCVSPWGSGGLFSARE